MSEKIRPPALWRSRRWQLRLEPDELKGKRLLEEIDGLEVDQKKDDRHRRFSMVYVATVELNDEQFETLRKARPDIRKLDESMSDSYRPFTKLLIDRGFF